MAVIVFGNFRADCLQKRTGLDWPFQAKQTLADMRAEIYVHRIAFERRTVAGLGFVQFALLEINIAELKIMVGFIEMMDLPLEFPDAFSVMRARQFKPAGGGRRLAVNQEKV